LNDIDFLRSYLPSPPARILEIGCGNGKLARQLNATGYEVVAIDPKAPRGKIFRRIPIEEFEDIRPFHAAIAIVSLHHVSDLRAALDRVHEHLRQDGVFILEEFAYERLLNPNTARWYFYQRQAALAAGLHRDRRLPRSFALWRKTWKIYRDLHTSEEMRTELRRRFRRRFFEWTPYLYSYYLDETLKPVEEKLIISGGILATGFRWVGTPRK
jgi:SAM-dependent methyltransferase